ncbi:MAG: hypothetical protein V4616_04940 [Bacteroidota bacterium]
MSTPTPLTDDFKRLALIIGLTPEHCEVYLRDFMTFLSCKQAGAWKPEEMVLLCNPGRATIIEELDRHGPLDQLMMIYSGNCYIPSGDELMIQLGERGVSLKSFYNEAPRQIFIVEDCRTPLASPSLSEQLLLVPKPGRKNIELLYRKKISASHPGTSVISAAKSDMPHKLSGHPTLLNILVKNVIHWASHPIAKPILSIKIAQQIASLEKRSDFRFVPSPTQRQRRIIKYPPLAVL